MKVCALAGGVGGAKLAGGLQDVLPPGELSMVVNTADDFDLWGLHICPDLDTVMYTLAGISNPETGWGIANESFETLSMLASYGEETWFKLGDRDLATHILRTSRMRSGETLTDITAGLSGALGVESAVRRAEPVPAPAAALGAGPEGQGRCEQARTERRWDSSAHGQGLPDEAAIIRQTPVRKPT